jgi:Uma2 family endonuclease
MGLPVRLHRHSFKDYLAVEEVSRVKHEFLDGEIYAMAGGSILHAALSISVSSALHAQLRGRCRVYSSGLRVRVTATGLASYPDVTIVCGEAEADPESRETIVNPTAVVEILSPGTIDYDLGEKFEHYKKIASLHTVVYVWQDRRQIEVRERGADAWRSRVFAASEHARLEALACDLDVGVIYTDAGGP